MMIRLQNYDVKIVYKKGKEMYLADTLSRAYPFSVTTQETVFDRVNMVSFLPIRQERLVQIRNATEQDESLQMLRSVILQGWPENKNMLPTQVTPYFNHRDEISVQDGLIFRGERVIIPHSMRREMMNRIHSSHIGIDGCLRRARECLYWPGLTSDLKNHISSCEICRSFETSQPKETLMSHEIPHRPWQKVASDLFTFRNEEYLVTVDYYSDYYELDKLPNTKSLTVIRATKCHFARHGIPETLVSDNGPQYISDDFAAFAKEWDFDHVTISPHHSRANGKVESAVKKAKNILRKSDKAHSDTYLALLDQRNTPTQGMGSSPVQRLMNRRTRTLLPTKANLLQPRAVNPAQERGTMEQKQLRHAMYYNRNARDLKPLEEGDVVRMKPFTLGQKEWRKAVVSRRLDERSYEVETAEATYRRNRMHLKKTNEPSFDRRPTEQCTTSCGPVKTSSAPCDSPSQKPLMSNVTKPVQSPHHEQSPVRPALPAPSVKSQTLNTVPLRSSSGRTIKPPAYLSDYTT